MTYIAHKFDFFFFSLVLLFDVANVLLTILYNHIYFCNLKKTNFITEDNLLLLNFSLRCFVHAIIFIFTTHKCYK